MRFRPYLGSYFQKVINNPFAIPGLFLLKYSIIVLEVYLGDSSEYRFSSVGFWTPRSGVSMCPRIWISQLDIDRYQSHLWVLTVNDSTYKD